MGSIPEAAVAAPDLVSSLAGPALRMVGALIVLGVCAYVLVRWQKRARRSRSDLEVLDRAFLTRSASVAIIRVESRRLLLGVSTDGVRLLTDIEAAESLGRDRAFEDVLDDLPNLKEATP